MSLDIEKVRSLVEDFDETVIPALRTYCQRWHGKFTREEFDTVVEDEVYLLLKHMEDSIESTYRKYLLGGEATV